MATFLSTNANFTKSNDDLTAERTAVNSSWQHEKIGPLMSDDTGSHTIEITIESGLRMQCGIVRSDLGSGGAGFVGSHVASYGYDSDFGYKYNNSSYSGYGATYTTSDVIKIVFDSDAGTVEFVKNDVSQGVAYTGISGDYYFGCSCYNVGWQSTIIYVVPVSVKTEAFISVAIASVTEQSVMLTISPAQLLEQIRQLRITPSKRAERALNFLINISTLYEQVIRFPIIGYMGHEAFQQLRISGALQQLEAYRNFTIEDFDRLYYETTQRFSIYGGLTGIITETGISLIVAGSNIPFISGSGGDQLGSYFKVYEFSTNYNELIRSLPDPDKSVPTAQIVWSSQINTSTGPVIVIDKVIELIFDSLLFSRSTNQSTIETAILRFVSPTAALGWLDGNLGALPITKIWQAGTMASTVLNDIFPESLEYDLQINDFPIGQFDVDSLYPNEIIPKIFLNCVIHTDDDGTLIIRNEPNILKTITPDHDASAQEYEISISDTDDQGQYRPNNVRVSNYQIADSSSSLSAPEIIPNEKDYRKATVYGYPVPFRQIWLQTSHLPHTNFSTVTGISETIETTEYNVEFIDGEASVSKPITGGLISYDFEGNTDLGIITPTEDGSLTAAISSTSIATITYSTIRYKFKISDYDEHSIQCWFTDEESV